MKLYCIHDHDDNLKRKGAFEIHADKIPEYNAQGYGIFMTVNEFNGARKAANLKKINFWLADIDEGTKEEMLENIKKLPLKPSIIVETKKGYHCYWRAINATAENYKEIEQGLIKRLNADKACTDVSRLLRFPTSYHMKDPANPFEIKIIEKNDKAYTERKMLCAYQLPKPKLKIVKYDGEKKDFLDQSKWERIFKLSLIGNGNRNSTLARYTLWLKDLRLGDNEIAYVINGLNQNTSEPLPQSEIDTMLKSKGIA